MDKCAHCSVDFKTTSGRKYSYLLVPSKSDNLSKNETEQSNSSALPMKSTTVSLLDAFKSIFNVPPHASGSEPVVNVCSRCYALLESAYNLVSDLSLVRATDSYCARKIMERDDLINKSLATASGRGSSGSPSPKRGNTTLAKKPEDLDDDLGESFDLIIDDVTVEFSHLNHNYKNPNDGDNASSTSSPGKKPIDDKKSKSRRSRSLGGTYSAVFKPRNSSGSTASGNKTRAAPKSSVSASAKKASSRSTSKGQAAKAKVIPKSAATIVTAFPESQVPAISLSSPSPSSRPSRNAKLNAYVFMNVSAENENSAKQILSKKNPVNASASPLTHATQNVPTSSSSNSKAENLSSKKPKRPVASSRSRKGQQIPESSNEPATPLSEIRLDSKTKGKSGKGSKSSRQSKTAAPSKPSKSSSKSAAGASTADMLSPSASTSSKSVKSKSAKKGRKVDVTPAEEFLPLVPVASPAPVPSSSRKRPTPVKVLASKKPKVTANPKSRSSGKGKSEQLKGKEEEPPSGDSSQDSDSQPLLSLVGAASQSSKSQSKGKASKSKSKKSKLILDQALASSVSLPHANINAASNDLSWSPGPRPAEGTPGPGVNATTKKGKPKPVAGVNKGKAVIAKITLPKKLKVPKVKVADASTSASPLGFIPPTNAKVGSKIKITEMETQTERPSAAFLIQQREEALDLTYKALQKAAGAGGNVEASAVPNLSNSILVPSSGSGNVSSIIETPKRSKGKHVKSVKFAETVSKLEIPARSVDVDLSGGALAKGKKKSKSKKGSGQPEVPVTDQLVSSSDAQKVGKKTKKNLKKEGQVVPASAASASASKVPVSSSSSNSTEVLAVKSNPPASSPTTKFQCPDCVYEAPARFNLQRHQIGVHDLKDTAGPPFTCSSCSIEFTKKASFVIHLMGKCGQGAQIPAEDNTKGGGNVKVNKTKTKDKDKDKSSEKDKDKGSKSKSKKRSSGHGDDHKGKGISKIEIESVSVSDLQEPKAKKPKLAKKDKKDKDKSKPIQEVSKTVENSVGKAKHSRKRKKAEMNGDDGGSKDAIPSKSFRPAVSSSSSAGESVEPLKSELKPEILVGKPDIASTLTLSGPSPAKEPQSLLPVIPSASINSTTSTSNTTKLSSSSDKVVNLGSAFALPSTEPTTKVPSSIPSGSESTSTTVIPPLSAPSPNKLVDGHGNGNTSTALNSSDETTTTMSSESSDPDETISTTKTSSHSAAVTDEGKDKDSNKKTVPTTTNATTSNTTGSSNSNNITGKELLVNSNTNSLGKDKETKVVSTTTPEKNLVTMSADSTTGSASSVGASPGGSSSSGVSGSGVVSGSSDTASSGNAAVVVVGAGAGGGGGGAGSGAAVGVGIGA